MVLDSSTADVSAGGYRVSVWNFNRTQNIDLVCHDDLDLQQSCLGLSLLQRTISQGLSNQPPIAPFQPRQVTTYCALGQTAQVYLTNQIQFLTVEKSCIKLWQFHQGNFKLQKRIQIKQSIKQCHVAELTSFLMILGMNGKVLILDLQGEFVSTISREGVFFSDIATANDKLLLGTERGTIHVYHLASFQFVSEIPYQMTLLQDTCLNASQATTNLLSHKQQPTEIEAALLKLGPPVESIETTSNLRFLKIKYRDSSFVIVDRTVGQPAEAIMGFQYGHFEAITGLQWIGSAMQSKQNLVSDQYQLIHQANECFVTCSSDLSIYLWRHFGDRWQYNYIDVAKCFDDSLIHQRKMCDKSTKALSLTAIQMLPRRQNLAVADNRGTLRIFQLANESATLLSTYRLQRSPESVGEPSQAIASVYFTENEQVAVVTFETGLISAYDVKGSFAWIGDIEKDVTRSSQGARCLSRVIETTKQYARDQHYHQFSITFKGMEQPQEDTSLFCEAQNCVMLQQRAI